MINILITRQAPLENSSNVKNKGVLGAASFHSGFGGLMFNGLVHTGKRKRSPKLSQGKRIMAGISVYIISSSSLPFLFCHIPY